jgi:regulator of protease activity HflC (stomatin/prohibitin superfamily)
MALQKQADQEKRAAILQSEGAQQSQINVAEGQKQAQIKQAEGDRQSQILRAEGQKQAQVLEAEGRARAIGSVYGAINAGNPTPELIAVLQLDTLGRVATSANSKVIVPMEAAGLLGAAQALKSVLDEVPTANGSLRGGGNSEPQGPSAPRRR